jgi:hypothetical protein
VSGLAAIGTGAYHSHFSLDRQAGVQVCNPQWGGSLSGGKHRNNLLSDLFFFVSGNYIYLEWPLE